MERGMNEVVHTRVGIEKELASRLDQRVQRVLRWFGQVERMNEYRMANVREVRIRIHRG